MQTNYTSTKIYQALKQNLLMDLRYVSLRQFYNQHLKIRNRRVFIINTQKDVLYYPDIHFFSRKDTRMLKLHNYVNTVRTLEDIKILSEAFDKTDKVPKDLNHWFSDIYNLREPLDRDGEPVKETLSNIKTKIGKNL